MRGEKMPRRIKSRMISCNSAGAVYGLGFVGAAIYYLVNATGFWNGVLGILKAIIWPAILTYGLLKLVGL